MTTFIFEDFYFYVYALLVYIYITSHLTFRIVCITNKVSISIEFMILYTLRFKSTILQV